MKFEQLYPYFLALVIFFQTLFPKQAPLFIVLALCFEVLGWIKKAFEWKMPFPFLLFIILYLFYVLGIPFTLDEAMAMKTLEYKMSFVIFPVLFAIRPKHSFSIQIPAIAFISAIILASLWAQIHFINCLGSNEIVHCLSYFSNIHHPSYFASYLFVAILLAAYGYLQKWEGFNKWTTSLFVLYAVGTMFMTVSLASLIFVGVIGLGFIWTVVKSKIGKLKAVFAMVGLGFLLFTVVIFSPLKTDFIQTTSSVKEYLKSPQTFVQNGNRYLTGNEMRLIFWTVAVENIGEHPLGVGTGNTDIITKQKMQSYGLYELGSYNYNPHNQFLQFGVEIGLAGLFTFLLLLFLFFKKAFQTKNWVLYLLLVNIVFNCFFESMFQRQSGIVFYTFWMCLFYLYYELKNRKNDSSQLQTED